MSGIPVYFDHHATTPIDPHVWEVINQLGSECLGNPHSSTHLHGRRARAFLDRATAQLADLIGALPREIVFTPGATFANNLALLGLSHLKNLGRNRIIVATTEHPCVLETARFLGENGFAVIEVAVDSEGYVDLKSIERELNTETALISIMLGNNEIGVLQPVREIADLAHKVGALVHTDAAQVVGKLPVDVDALGVDLMSFTSHKMCGPGGIGALFVRDEVPLKPITHGGGQQPFQSGTLPTFLCAGFGVACDLASSRVEGDMRYMALLRDNLWQQLQAGIADIELNGPRDFSRRLPNNLNVHIPGIDIQELTALLAPQVSVSAGAACASSKTRYSHVLKALGYLDTRIKSSMRIGLGRSSTVEEVCRGGVEIIKAVQALRSGLRAAE
jgi:cysteine desulfurase